MAHLRPCTACDRHVRANVSACPFCSAPLAIDDATPAQPQERLGRAARMAFGGVAALAMTALVGCDKKENIAMPYGAPPNPQPMLDAAPEVPPSDPVATAPDAAPPVVADAGAADAGKKPPPKATATAKATNTSPPNFNKPYGAPPADGYDVFEVFEV